MKYIKGINFIYCNIIKELSKRVKTWSLKTYIDICVKYRQRGQSIKSILLHHVRCGSPCASTRFTGLLPGMCCCSTSLGVAAAARIGLFCLIKTYCCLDNVTPCHPFTKGQAAFIDIALYGLIDWIYILMQPELFLWLGQLPQTYIQSDPNAHLLLTSIYVGIKLSDLFCCFWCPAQGDPLLICMCVLVQTSETCCSQTTPACVLRSEPAKRIGAQGLPYLTWCNNLLS